MGGDHGQGVIRATGGPSRPVEVGGEWHGRENTADRRRFCERGCDVPEPFGIGAGAALLKRPRVELPEAPDPAWSGCLPVRLRAIGQPPLAFGVLPTQPACARRTGAACRQRSGTALPGRPGPD